MGKRVRLMVSLFLMAVLVGCSSALDEELSIYIEEVVFDIHEKAHEELTEIEQKYIKALEKEEAEVAFTILEDEYVPKVKETEEKIASYDVDEEEVKELNDLLVTEYQALKDRLEKQAETFTLLTEMKTDEDLQEALKEMDVVVEETEAYIDARETFNDELLKIADENNPDVEVEIEENDELGSNDVKDIVQGEFVWFTEGLGYGSNILESGELGESIGNLDSTNELQVQMIGEVEVGDGYVVAGESNLPAGAEVEGAVYVFDDEVSKEHVATVQEDGSFEIDIPDVELEEEEIELRVRFRPADQEEDLQEIYGEIGENMEGDYIYRYSSIKRTYHEARMSVRFIPSEEDTVAFERPDWNPPEDYGGLDIWMEVEDVKERDEFYDIHVRSNFVEGTRVKGDIEIPGYDTGGFGTSTFVQPDGSFIMQIQNPDVDEEIIVQLEMLPNSLLFLDTEELYGEEGEHLKGDLVEKHSKGKKIHFEHSIK